MVETVRTESRTDGLAKITRGGGAVGVILEAISVISIC